MDAAEIRRQFAAYCGTERCRQFVKAMWGSAMAKQRLVYWQEKLWREFSESSGSALPASFPELQRVFRVCPRHMEPMEDLDRPRASRLAASLGDVPEDDRDTLFPFALIVVTQRGTTELLSCPTCRFDLEVRGAAARPGT